MMSHHLHASPRRTLRSLVLLLCAALLSTVGLTGTASAHGTTINPASRNYGCWLRWGNDFQNPSMAQQDPMCWQAWQTDVNAMWNWNGLYREGVGGNHQAAIPNGQLCSAGRTQGGRYRAMDTPGAWKTTALSRVFTINLMDQAYHGADYIRVYITRPGFNPGLTPLGWSDLELITVTGRYAPAGNYMISNINAGSRTGRHMVFTIWQASHFDQSYYFCSDVTF